MRRFKPISWRDDCYTAWIEVILKDDHKDFTYILVCLLQLEVNSAAAANVKVVGASSSLN